MRRGAVQQVVEWGRVAQIPIGAVTGVSARRRVVYWKVERAVWMLPPRTRDRDSGGRRRRKKGHVRNSGGRKVARVAAVVLSEAVSDAARRFEAARRRDAAEVERPERAARRRTAARARAADGHGDGEIARVADGGDVRVTVNGTGDLLERLTPERHAATASARGGRKSGRRIPRRVPTRGKPATGSTASAEPSNRVGRANQPTSGRARARFRDGATVRRRRGRERTDGRTGHEREAHNLS